MHYDSDKIEMKAVSAVKDFVIECNLLKPFFNEYDKIPEFDGEIYIYKDTHHKNENLVGKVPVQIKGKTVKKLKNKLKYPVSITSLKNYYNAGGVVFFVVQICDSQKRIFYKSLEPLRIKNILKKATKENQQTISIEFDQIPEEKTAFEEKIKEFYFNHKNQISNSISFSEAQKQNIKLFTTRFYNIDNSKNILLQLSSREFFLYGQINEHLIPIEGVHKPVFQEKIRVEIGVGKKIFFRQATQQIKDGKYNLIAGGCLTMVFQEKGNNVSTSISFKNNSETLKGAILETEFFLEMIKNQIITINGKNFQIEKGTPSISEKELEDKLAVWKNWEKALDILHLNKDISLPKLSNNDAASLNILYSAFVENQCVSIDTEKENAVLCMEISDVSVVVAAYWKNDIQKFELKDFFDSKQDVSYLDRENNKHLATVYSFLKEDGILRCDNIPYSEIIPAYDSLKDIEPEICYRGCLDLLEFLKAIDNPKIDADKRKKLLVASYDLATWLIKNDSDTEIERSINHTINLFQVIRRQREFSEEEKNKLIELEDGKISYMQKSAINLLLENHERFNYFFKKLSKDDQQTFQSMPIANFMKKE